MWPALKLTLSPLLAAQIVATRRRALILPEAAGPRSGWLGDAEAEPLSVLIAGDSSAAGVGVATQSLALAGHYTRELQRLTARRIGWSLHARSGLNTAKVHALLQAGPLPAADIALVVTGVNDLIDRIAPAEAVRHRAALADWLLGTHRVAHVVFAPLPPVHQFPLLPEPLRWVVGRDARLHDRAMARWAATRHDVSHAPIDVTLSVANMASDGFHPGEPVYRTCGLSLAAHTAGLAAVQGPVPRQRQETRA